MFLKHVWYLKYRELAKGARAQVDTETAGADQERIVADASNAAAAVAAAAAHSAGKSSSGIPLVAVILLLVVAFVAGRMGVASAIVEMEESVGEM